MTHLEQLISRYLDHELTAQETTDLHHLLDTSAEARQILRQMEELRSAARRLPGLSQPSPALESALFQQLFAEESEESKAAVVLPSSGTVLGNLSRRISRTLVPALVVLVAAGAGLWALLAGNQGENAPIAAATTIVQSAPEAAPSTRTTSPGLSGPLSETPENLPRVSAAETGQHSGFASRKNPVQQVSQSASQTISTSSTTTPVIEKQASGTDNPAFASTIEKKTNGAAAEIDSGIHEQAQWPPSTLLARQEETLLDNTAALADAREDNSAEQPPLRSLLHHARKDDRNVVTASYRHGLSYVQGGREELAAQDFNIRVEGHFHERHRLSLAVGQSPLLIERTTTTLPTGVAVDPDEKSPRTASEQVEHSSRLADEVWAGIGYGFAVISASNFRVEPGLSFGVGEESIRYGAELPIRYRLNDRFSIDLVASLSRVEPHDASPQDVERAYNQPFFLHVDEDERPSFTTIGAHIGLSLDIGR